MHTCHICIPTQELQNSESYWRKILFEYGLTHLKTKVKEKCTLVQALYRPYGPQGE